MSEQSITFEKFFPRPLAFADKAHELEMMSKWNDAKITWETSLEAATAEANKRINALESEVAYFKQVCEQDKSLVIKAERLKASNNTLREALESCKSALVEVYNDESVPKDLRQIADESHGIAKRALSATPAESLKEVK